MARARRDRGARFGFLYEYRLCTLGGHRDGGCGRDSVSGRDGGRYHRHGGCGRDSHRRGGRRELDGLLLRHARMGRAWVLLLEAAALGAPAAEDAADGAANDADDDEYLRGEGGWVRARRDERDVEWGGVARTMMTMRVVSVARSVGW